MQFRVFYFLQNIPQRCIWDGKQSYKISNFVICFFDSYWPRVYSSYTVLCLWFGHTKKFNCIKQRCRHGVESYEVYLTVAYIVSLIILSPIGSAPNGPQNNTLLVLWLLKIYPVLNIHTSKTPVLLTIPIFTQMSLILILTLGFFL